MPVYNNNNNNNNNNDNKFYKISNYNNKPNNIK